MCVSKDDVSFIAARNNLKLAYEKAYNNRRRTILLDKDTVIQLKNATVTPKLSDPPKVSTVPKQKTEPLICKAVNMNGEKCKAKAKANGVCGRHKLK
jgi:hypothetical protein